MNFEIYCYTNEDGREPVQEYIENLTEPEQAKVYAYLGHLEEVGYQVRRPFGDYLGAKTELYELRPGRNRILYFFLHRGKIILLHAFLKKTQEIPEREMNTALKRKEMCKIALKYKAVRYLILKKEGDLCKTKK